MKKHAATPFVFVCLAAMFLTEPLAAQSTSYSLARVFWQDSATQTIYWGDLKRDTNFSLSAQPIEGFPALDVDHQMLVQMQPIDDLLLVGVRDDVDGTLQSGWVAIQSGATLEEHGDHFHIHYGGQPSVKKSQLNDQQGNPAHVYVYSGKWYLANDKKNGFTQISPQALQRSEKADEFFSAGGGHITLAVSAAPIAYATWIDRDGANMGRVDIVDLYPESGTPRSFHLHSGGIHGATYNSDKVFFAPSEGISWVHASTVDVEPEVHCIDLGLDASGTPRRTGAFANAGRYVVYVTGRGKEAELHCVDAASPKPQIFKLPLDVEAGNSVTTPAIVRTRSGRMLAILFEENAEANAEQMHVVSLDSNRDGNFADALVTASISVGKSQIQGHGGHHQATSLAEGRYVLVTNPGDGSLQLFSTADWSQKATLDVGGTPTRIVAF